MEKNVYASSHKVGQTKYTIGIDEVVVKVSTYVK